MQNRLKKLISMSLVISLVIGTMTACGSKAETASEAVVEKESINKEETASETEGRKDGTGITIRLFTRWSGADPATSIKDDVIEEFKNKYPNITIQDESTSDSNAFTNQFKTDIASGNIADIIMWPGISIMKEYADTGVFLDLTDLLEKSEDIKNNVDPTLLGMMELSSVGTPGTYALPVTNQMEVFYYNKDLFQQAGIDSPPQTWDEFFEVNEKLKGIGITPWAVGGSNAWRFVHIQTGLLYKMCGVNKAKELGSRKASWTDPDVVATISFLQKLADEGTFGKDYMGLDYETEKAMFINEQTAMSFDGSWRIGELGDMADKVGTFRMPYFADKAEFKDQDIAYPAQLELSGSLKDNPEKLEYVWELASMFAGKTVQEALAYKVGNVPVRTDITFDENKISPILAQLLEFKKSDIKVWGSDSWAYDTLAVLEDVVGEAFIGALSGMSAEEAAKQIQDHITEAETNK